MTAVELYNLGYVDLVSVIPPGATLHPDSKIAPDSRGKAPGIKQSMGFWTGYHWRDMPPSLDRAKKIDERGANVGLAATRFPAIDVDVRDGALADAISRIIERITGAKAMRVGQWPKRLYPFRLAGDKFSRMQLFIEVEGQRHIVEILAHGQQYLIGGIHPKTMKPYEWRGTLVPAEKLPTLSREQAEEVLTEIAELLDMLGIKCERAGNGRSELRAEVDQESLKATNLEAFEEVVRQIPNDNEHFATRDDYITFGYALKAATQDDPGLGLELWHDWCAQWEGNHNGPNRPEVNDADWERMVPPFSIGAGYIWDIAREYGINTAQYEFDAEPAPEPEEKRVAPCQYTDDWLSDHFVRLHSGRVRYVPEQEQWLGWNDLYWAPDKSAVPELVRMTCREVADRLSREGSTAKERAQNASRARSISSARQYAAVLQIARDDRRIQVPVGMLDADPDLLGTPNGIVDLKTGELLPPDPAKFITKCTAVKPDRRHPAPLWWKFLEEATGGDRELRNYLQRMAGYCLTSHIYEHVLFYLWGDGGNGKGTFANTLATALGTYQKSASMTTFTASNFDRHSTDMAALAGSRMVLAQEIRADQTWDEQRVKALTGGDPVTARFLFKDNFTFQPTFKLFLVGNDRPHLATIDEAMRRRIHLIPFTQKPKNKIPDLKEQIIAKELPAVLAWAIDGCIAWRREGLRPPKCVVEATEEYFRDEDVMGRWLGETCDPGQGEAGASELYQCWLNWCSTNNETSGSQKAFGAALLKRGFKKRRTTGGYIVYSGISLLGEFAMPVLV